MVLSKINRDRIKTLLINIGVWVVLMLTSIIEFSNNSDIGFTTIRLNLPMWSSCLLIFYVSYLLLIPVYLFKKRYILYGLYTILIILGSFVVVKTWVQYERIQNIEEKIIARKAAIEQESNLSEFDRGTYPPGYNKYPYQHTSADGVIDKSKFFTIDNYMPFNVRNVGIFYTMLITLSVALILRFFERTKYEEQRAISLEKEKVSSELEYLKQQINPHFLFNALNSIYSLSLLQSDKSPDAVLRLSSILRYMLYETNKERVQLSDEIEVIEDYLSLQKLRLTDKTIITFNKIGDFDPYLIEPMFLIPLIENAFKYGINTIQTTNIDITIKIERNKLRFTCENEIIRQSSDAKNSGIGIKNIQRRLDLLFDGEYKFKTKIEGNKFKVALNIPLGIK